VGAADAITEYLSRLMDSTLRFKESKVNDIPRPASLKTPDPMITSVWALKMALRGGVPYNRLDGVGAIEGQDFDFNFCEDEDGSWEGTLHRFQPDGSVLTARTARFDAPAPDKWPEYRGVVPVKPLPPLWPDEGSPFPERPGVLLFSGIEVKLDKALEGLPRVTEWDEIVKALEGMRVLRKRSKATRNRKATGEVGGAGKRMTFMEVAGPNGQARYWQGVLVAGDRKVLLLGEGEFPQAQLEDAAAGNARAWLPSW
jgi:hypothetical protein